MLQNRVLDELVCSSCRSCVIPIPDLSRFCHVPPSQNTQGPFIDFSEDIDFGKGDSASVAPGRGVVVLG